MTVELPQAVRFVLDTDSVTYHQLGRDAIIQRLGLLPANNVATTVVTMYEQLRGRAIVIKATKNYSWHINGCSSHKLIIAESSCFHSPRLQRYYIVTSSSKSYVLGQKISKLPR